MVNNFFIIAFIYLLSFSCLCYIAFVLALLAALRKTPARKGQSHPLVSVIIAARNERASIGACLASLIDQDYPSNLYEVIVADDRSNDGTSDVLARFQAVWSVLKIITITETPVSFSPKKFALTQAISCAKGEIILQTDADCIVPCSWITGMASAFDEDVGMVTGVAPYQPSQGFLNSFIRHEYLWNIILSAGSIAFGRGTHTSGRNMGFRRRVFQSLGGYGPYSSEPSGDDTLLLNRIRKLGMWRIVTISDISTHAYTKSPESFTSFLRQRLRHMSTGRRFDTFHIIIGAIIYSFHCLLLISLCLSFWRISFVALFCAFFLLKTAVDFIAAVKARRFFSLEVQWSRFLLNELFLVVYMACVPLVGALIPVRWK